MVPENRQLIERARQGDPDAFDLLVQEYAPRVHAVAYQMTGSAEDARDIAQEVFLRLYRALDRYDPERSFATWLYRVTVNLAIDFRRRNARHWLETSEERSETGNPGDPAQQPDLQVERRELEGAVFRLVSELPANGAL